VFPRGADGQSGGSRYALCDHREIRGDDSAKNMTITNVYGTLQSLEIVGPAAVDESEQATYTCRATYNLGDPKLITTG